MEEIRKTLMSGEGNKLTKKSYKFAVAVEKQRLLNQLVFMSLVSFSIAGVLFLSLYFDIIDGEY
jgi:hypothetical protein